MKLFKFINTSEMILKITQMFRSPLLPHGSIILYLSINMVMQASNISKALSRQCLREWSQIFQQDLLVSKLVTIALLEVSMLHLTRKFFNSVNPHNSVIPTSVGGPLFCVPLLCVPLFCYVLLILYDFPFLKFQNNNKCT